MLNITQENIFKRKEEMIQKGYSLNTIEENYLSVWNKALIFFENKEINDCNILLFCEKFSRDKIGYRYQSIYRKLNTLIDGIKPSQTYKYVKYERIFNDLSDYYKNIHQNYYDYCLSTLLNKEITIKNNSTSKLFGFYQYLEKRNILDVSLINKNIINDYIKILNKSVCTTNLILEQIKKFCRFLYCENLISKDISMYLKIKILPSDAKFKSIWKPEEIHLLIEHLKKQSKRDYAMLLLAIKLGIRASDIVNLKISDINWIDNKISFYQVKTNNYIEYPLLNEIGNAILEYMKHERPQSDYKNVFVSKRLGNLPLSTVVINRIIAKFITDNNLDFTGRKKGSHSFRYTLATELLRNENPLDIISSILGHVNQSTTTTYLAIDKTSLKKLGRDIQYDE